MMSPYEKVAASLDIFAKDCAVTVALKISDDSCKMDDKKRAVFMALYDTLPSYESQIFDGNIHVLIHEARTVPTAAHYARIKKERERAMAIITQEKMKSFKASVRAALLIAQLQP
jgi:ABC-type dipeptide/oligopeptide/nickel transport system ATPase component